MRNEFGVRLRAVAAVFAAAGLAFVAVAGAATAEDRNPEHDQSEITTKASVDSSDRGEIAVPTPRPGDDTTIYAWRVAGPADDPGDDSSTAGDDSSTAGGVNAVNAPKDPVAAEPTPTIPGPTIYAW